MTTMDSAADAVEAGGAAGRVDGRPAGSWSLERPFLALLAVVQLAWLGALGVLVLRLAALL
jgi:hypothetical protein